MNIEDLLAKAPSQAALDKGPDHARKSLAEDYISVVLNAIEEEKREPDLWEGHELATALGSILARRYYLSVNCTMKALTPLEDRGEDYADPPEVFSLRVLRDALMEVAKVPAKNI